MLSPVQCVGCGKTDSRNDMDFVAAPEGVESDYGMPVVCSQCEFDGYFEDEDNRALIVLS